LKVVLVVHGQRGEPASAARAAAGVDGIRE